MRHLYTRTSCTTRVSVTKTRTGYSHGLRGHWRMAAGRPAWVGGTLQRDADASDEECVQDVLRRESASSGVATETLRVSSVAALSVDAYVEYCRVVGDADGGELLTGTLLRLHAHAPCAHLRCANADEEYAAFRAKAAERAAQRLFVHWRNAAGFDCKAVGPATLCECGHRYREHATDALPQGGRGRWQPVDLRCRAAGCACSRFTYLPSAGAWQAKCACKHGAVRSGLSAACDVTLFDCVDSTPRHSTTRSPRRARRRAAPAPASSQPSAAAAASRGASTPPWWRRGSSGWLRGWWWTTWAAEGICMRRWAA